MKLRKGEKVSIYLSIAALCLFIIIYIPLEIATFLDKLIPEGVSINKEGVGLLSKAYAKEMLEKKYNEPLKDKKIVLKYENNVFSKSYKDFSLNYNIEEAVEQAFSHGKDGENIIERTLDRIISKNNDYNIELSLSYDSRTIDEFLSSISKKINREPVNAKLLFKGDRFEVTKEVVGRRVEDDKLKKLIKDALMSREESIDIPVTTIEPKLKSEVLSKVNQKIASFTTYLSNNPNRTTNIKIAASHVNGTLLLPGEVFSADKAIGPRTAARGYKEAPVFNNGKVDTDLAGGICQVSTTIYNVALLANLKIVERHPHSLSVSYVPLGRDAAISGGGPDLKFKNTTNYPIYIQTIVNDRQITVNFYGFNEHPERRVEIESETVQSNGKTIYKTYRKVYENNKLMNTELLSSDSYKNH
ncbi:VanW family protein [Fonticella tunisiensis]|uniref:Putative peptidoglycan binding protein n=1 Tax=Fonticella tunisiensis TaxID=1096341 RepID=A0A4R7KD10_9CLOT|nr:VanW family protein [Fonticella tunisiensis]TDT51337.1 putative peptidoglycan binding protein [Fonticella tunisiensis]